MEITVRDAGSEGDFRFIAERFEETIALWEDYRVTEESISKQQERVAVEALLQRVRVQSDLASALGELCALRFVERVAEINARYAKALQIKDKDAPTYDDILGLRRAGQKRLCRIVFRVVARLVVSRKNEAEALSEALAAVIEQNAAIGRYYRRRRRVTDVDPESGSEIGETQQGGNVSSIDAPSGEPTVANPIASTDAVARDRPEAVA